MSARGCKRAGPELRFPAQVRDNQVRKTMKNPLSAASRPRLSTASRLRRWAALALAAAILFPIAFLSLLPPLFGREPDVAVASVDQAMCVLDADGSAGIIVGGDSRAKNQVIPAVLEEETGKRAVNVGEVLHLGGDPATLINVLRKYPKALEGHPDLILSLTLDGLNDLGFKGTPMATLLNWTAYDHFRVAVRRPKAWPLWMSSWFLPNLGRLCANKWKGNLFACDTGVYRPPALLAEAGYSAVEGKRLTGFWLCPSIRRDYLLDGGRWKAFQAALAWLDRSPVRTVLLYNAPIDTAWLRRTDGDVPLEMEARFSDMVAAEAARHPKVAYLDFFRHPLAELDSSMFYDQCHLNRPGAEIFSRRLGRYLAARAVTAAATPP
jgi:hypothetical protein